MSATPDITAGNETINTLMQRTAETIADAVQADHVLLMFFDDILDKDPLKSSSGTLPGDGLAYGALNSTLESIAHDAIPANLEKLPIGQSHPDCTVHIEPMLNLAIFQHHIDQNTAFRQGRIRIVGDVAVVASLRPIMLRQSNATGDGFRE